MPDPNELIQRAQALVDGSISLNEFKAWFTYTMGDKVEAKPTTQPTPPVAMDGEALAKALASAPGHSEPDPDPRPLKDKAPDIRRALELAGFKRIQIERADYGFAYDVRAEYEGKQVQKLVSRPDIPLVVDILRDEASG